MEGSLTNAVGAMYAKVDKMGLAERWGNVAEQVLFLRGFST
jgi:hypothetical protein